MPEQHTKTRHWLTQAEAADYLGITDRTGRNLIAAGDLPAYRLGKRMMRINADDLDAMLRRIPTAGGGQIA